MGLTNEQWKRLYNQAIDQRKEVSRELARVREAVASIEDELNQVAGVGSSLTNNAQYWTLEQTKDCGQVVRNHAEKALSILVSTLDDRPVIGAQ